MKNLTALYLALLGFQVMAEETFSYGAEIDFGYGYESNVSVDDIDLSTNIGDQFADISLSLESKYNTQNKLQFSADLTLNQKLYNTFDQFDGLLSLVNLSLDKEVGKYELGLRASYIDYQLNNDGFLRLTQLSPNVGWFYKKKAYLYLAFVRSDETFKRDSNRDSRSDEIRTSFYYFLSGLQKYFVLQAESSQKRADSSIFDNDAWQIQISFFNRITFFSKDSTVKLAYLYQERDYQKSANPIIGSFREDRRRRYEIGIDTPIGKNWSVITKASYNDYASNLASADYAQKVYQVSVRYAF